VFLSGCARGFLTSPWLFTVGVGFFLMGCTSAEDFGSCIQACTLAFSFLPIGLNSSLVPIVSGRVRELLAGGTWDGPSLEVVGYIPRSEWPLYCNMYTCSGNCIQERSAGFPMFSLIILFILISLIGLQPRSYIKAR